MFGRSRLVLTIAGISMLVSAGCQPPYEVIVPVINTPPGGLGSNTTQSEPHIAAWDSVIVAGWNDFKSGITLVPTTAFAYSVDGGETWVDARPLPPVNYQQMLLSGKNTGDPVISVDRGGTFYFATMAQDLSGSNYIGVAVGVVTSNGSTRRVEFGPPVLVAGSDLRVMQDKPWIAVDTTNGVYSGRVYLCWKDLSDGKLRFVRSTVEGPQLQFGPSKELSSAGKGCNIGVGPSGDVYVTWMTEMGTDNQKIHIRTSSDGGDSFPPDSQVIVAPQGGAQLLPSGAMDASTECERPALHGYIRIPDWPLIAVDQNNGTIYIAFNAGGGVDDDADVFIVRSPRIAGQAPGDSWTPPLAINKAGESADTSNGDNWMPAIAVAANGTVAVTYYERQSDSAKIHVYRSTSPDGVNWTREAVTSVAFGVPPLLPNFDPVPAKCYMGDYNGMAAVGNDFHLVWGDNSNLVQGRPDPDISYRKRP